MKKAYYYLFYKLYKHYEKGPSIWMSDWKASFSIDVLLYFIIASAFIYYKILFNRSIHLSDSNFDILIIVTVVAGSNYMIFHRKEQWKTIIADFDELPKQRNKIGGWIVFSIVIMVIMNLIFSIYQMSLIDWSQYR